MLLRRAGLTASAGLSCITCKQQACSRFSNGRLLTSHNVFPL